MALLSHSFFIGTIRAKGGGKMVKLWNPSPRGIRVGDCSVRALAKALDTDWETAYMMLCVKGFEMNDMPNSNAVIDAVLKDHKFFRQAISPSCKDCITEVYKYA